MPYHPVLDIHITSQSVTWIGLSWSILKGFMACTLRTLSSPPHGVCAYPTLTSDSKKALNSKSWAGFIGRVLKQVFSAWSCRCIRRNWIPWGPKRPQSDPGTNSKVPVHTAIQALKTWHDLPWHAIFRPSKYVKNQMLPLRSVQHRSCFCPGL